MKKTLLSIGLALCAGITYAQSLVVTSQTNEATTYQVVTNYVPQVSRVATHQIQVTQRVQPVYISDPLFDGICAMASSNGIHPAAAVYATNTARFGVSAFNATNGVYIVTVRARPPTGPTAAFVPVEQQFAMTPPVMHAFCQQLSGVITSSTAIDTNNFAGCSGTRTATNGFVVNFSPLLATP